MDKLLMTYQDVQQTSTDFKTTSEEVDNIIQELATLVETLGGAWIGDAYNAFNAKQQEITPQLKRFSELCTTISGQLDQASQSMQEADSQVSSQMSS